MCLHCSNNHMLVIADMWVTDTQTRIPLPSTESNMVSYIQPSRFHYQKLKMNKSWHVIATTIQLESVNRYDSRTSIKL